MLTNWTFIIPGFTQSVGSRSLMIELWERLHVASKPRTDVVRLNPWKSDWTAEADLVRWSSHNPRIRICAYSWGAGWGAIQLCKAFQRRGMFIDRLALIDPVYRHPSVLLRWQTLLPSIVPIRLPPSVTDRTEVLVFAQTMNWPRAHRVLRPSGIEVRPRTILCTHESAHSDPITIEACYQFLRGHDG